MKAFLSMVSAAIFLLSASAMAKTCTVGQASDDLQVLHLTLEPYQALLQVRDPAGHFPRLYQFTYSPARQESDAIYYVGENFSMIFHKDTNEYDIDAVLVRTTLAPGRLYHFQHISCQD